jgi:hypothetical protein
VVGVRNAAGAGMHEKKPGSAEQKTYIRALLALELGDGLLGRAGVESHLIKTRKVNQLEICD